MTIILKLLVLLGLLVATVSSSILFPWWVTIALVLLTIGGLMSWLLLFASNAKRETTFVPTGEIMFLVQGDSCLKVLANLESTGWIYDKHKKEIVMDDDKEEIVNDNKKLSWMMTKKKLSMTRKNKHPRSFFGVYWVSILYPMRQVHVWMFEWVKLLNGDPEKKENTYKIEHRKEWVDSLFLFYTYPIDARSVELMGNIQINILAMITIRIVDPIKAVFVFKGAYISLVSAAINGAIADFGRKLTLDEFRTQEKEGPDNDFSKELFKLNGSKDKDGTILGEGIPKVWGIAIHKVDFISFDLSTTAKAVQDATMAVEVARLEQLADVERGKGIVTIGQSTATAFEARLGTAVKYPGGMEALQTQLQMEGVSAFQGSVLSLGQQSPLGVVIDPKTTENGKEKTR